MSLYDFCILFLLFFSFSVAGYITEITYCSILNKKIVFNRGFLIGPYLPIYGASSILISAMLSKYKSDLLAVFTLGAVIATVVEYLTSYVMEKLFKTRWWDYSKESFNVNGRVCLKNSILFGFGSVLIVLIVDRYLSFIYSIDKTLFIIISLLFLVIFLTDLVISNLVVFKIRKNSILARFDMTEEVKDKVKIELSRNIFLTKRLLSSFPDIFENVRDTIKKLDDKRKTINKKNKEKIKKIMKK